MYVLPACCASIIIFFVKLLTVTVEIMFEARLASTLVLKKIVDALKEIINQSTLDCSDDGIQVYVYKRNQIPKLSNYQYSYPTVAVNGQFTCLAGGDATAA